ncbi:2'-5' RNA ligase [Ruminococcaceae bacterium FB2012]|nr:2'-5' RNA ligase [Ruminococcaceae bacterium FB2012]
MRLFVSVELTEQLREALGSVREQLRKSGVSGNWSPRENLHLTLAFIGEHSDPDSVLKALEKVRFRPFELRLEGIGSFGRLWWAGLSESRELKNLSAQVRHFLAEEGIPFDRKAFSPHITLVREPDRQRIPQVTVPAASMTVNSFSLMRSDRGKRGMIYTELGSIEAETVQLKKKE